MQTMSPKSIEFSKYQGAGNDFIMLDNRDKRYSNLTTEEIAFMCNRHFGIGADGLITINKSCHYDFKMRYYNSDGKEGSMCGNGGRCVVMFAHHLEIIEDRTIFDAFDGVHEATVLNEDSIRLKMQDCLFPEKIDKTSYKIDTGSPHIVVFVKDVYKIDVLKQGKTLRYNNDIFENGANVNFCHIENNKVNIRTYERGVENETLACGTGSVAAAICVNYTNMLHLNKIKINALGGTLEVEFSKMDKYSNIFLSGLAEKTFEGMIELI